VRKEGRKIKFLERKGEYESMGFGPIYGLLLTDYYKHLRKAENFLVIGIYFRIGKRDAAG
jgi:hypothetical protein